MNYKHNIILIGYMGSGKTSVGKLLAGRLSYQFIDTDYLIEKRAGCTIKQVFKNHGEEYFRTMETDLLMELCPSLDRTVLSTGGGLPIKEKNAVILRETGKVIFLKTSKETLVNRLKGDSSRPLLKGEELDKKIEHMLYIREPIYEKTAQLTVMTDDKTIEEIINIIMDKTGGLV